MKVVIEHLPASPPDNLSAITETAAVVSRSGYNLSGTANANVRTVEVPDQHHANVLTNALAHIRGIRIFHHAPADPAKPPVAPNAPVVTDPIDFQNPTANLTPGANADVAYDSPGLAPNPTQNPIANTPGNRTSTGSGSEYLE